MFSSGMMETTSNRLELPDIEKNTFEAFKTYIYTGQENINKENVVELLRAAALFQVKVQGTINVCFVFQTPQLSILKSQWNLHLKQKMFE